MSELVLLGVSHRTAPVALRERLAVPADEIPAQLRTVAHHAGLDEALLVSTCNRVELVGVARDALSAPDALRRWMEERTGGHGKLREALYFHRGAAAVRHVFRVASSLDSLVVGEPQILGQVKEAYSRAAAAGVLGSVLDRCFTRAFAVAKRVRNETAIAAGTVSVSSIACDLATNIFGDLTDRRVLLVGAGKMGESAAKHLAKQGARIFVLNRSRERAVAIAEACGGEPRSQAELASELTLADVVVSSTSASQFVIGLDLMRDVVRARKYRTLFLIDIAVPRDVDPRVGQLENVFLYDVDDLQKVASENLASRRAEAEKAESIVEGEVADFEAWRRQQSLKPVILALRGHVHQVLRAELERTLPRLGSNEAHQREALERMIEAAANKLLHPTLAHLKRAVESGDDELAHTAARLFGIEGEVPASLPSIPPPPKRSE